jgi:LmbE family N-acetylglucosaminyl deacetylase
MNVIMIGAHPDDCEFCGGGTAALLARAGHRVKLLSVTNGDKGHMSYGPAQLAHIRRGEARAAAEALGASWEVLGVPDCHAVPTIALREKLVGIIRDWKADVVISHRSNDYHPDHRNTGLLVQDTAYLVMVPLFCRRIAVLRANPVYLYFQDRFKSPEPFRPDIIVPIDRVFTEKVEALNRMPSQLHEWLPWVEGELDKVPESIEGRRRFTEMFIRDRQEGLWRKEISSRYGRAASKIRMVEAFQLCEYGRQPSKKELDSLFPGPQKKSART